MPVRAASLDTFAFSSVCLNMFFFLFDGEIIATTVASWTAFIILRLQPLEKRWERIKISPSPWVVDAQTSGEVIHSRRPMDASHGVSSSVRSNDCSRNCSSTSIRRSNSSSNRNSSPSSSTTKCRNTSDSRTFSPSNFHSLVRRRSSPSDCLMMGGILPLH